MFKSMAILDSSPWPPFGDLVPTHPLKSHLRSQDHRGRMGCKPTYEIGCMPSWARYWDGGVPHPAAWDTNEASLRRRALHTEKGWVGGQSIVSLENLFGSYKAHSFSNMNFCRRMKLDFSCCEVPIVLATGRPLLSLQDGKLRGEISNSTGFSAGLQKIR